MTRKELEAKLANMSEPEKESAYDDLIYKHSLVATCAAEDPATKILNVFERHPKSERILAQMFDMPTEDEKKTDACVRSAEAAERSAFAAEDSSRSARHAKRWAIFGIIATLIISLLGLGLSVWM